MKPRHNGVISRLHFTLRDSYLNGKSDDYRQGVNDQARKELIADSANPHEVDLSLAIVRTECARIYKDARPTAARVGGGAA